MHRRQPHLRPRDLCRELHRYALAGPQRQHERVRPDAHRSLLGEPEVRHRAQRDRDLGDLARQALAGAQVERHARPAPVVDLQAQRREGLGARVRRDALLLGVAGHLEAADDAPRVLRRGRPCVGTSSGAARRWRCEDLDLLVAHLVGTEVDRRLHRHQAEQLQHVVLDHVAERAGAVVVAGAGADPEVLGGGDLDVVDVVAVPQRLEHRRWRTGTPGCSGPSPCPGSGRCGRSAARRRPTAPGG